MLLGIDEKQQKSIDRQNICLLW